MKPGRQGSRHVFRLLVALVIGIAMLVVALDRRALVKAQDGVDQELLGRVVASLTVDERVGQLVMVNFVGDDVSAESDIASLVRDFKVGAVLVTASNGNVVNRGDTPAQLAALTNGLQQRAFESNRRASGDGDYFVPLLIATDNEGDLFPFTNVTNGYTPLPNNMTIGATWKKEHAQNVGEIAGRELSAAGVNMLLGPVVDVLENPRSGGDGDIGIRSFGGVGEWVGALGRAYIRGVHEGSQGRMLTVAKHFPGHGGSDRSTDSEVPTVNKSLEQLRASDLVPFGDVARFDEQDAQGTTDAIMVSHIRYRNFLEGGSAPFTRPISLDSAAFHGFFNLPEFRSWRDDHLVMSDSLGVPAVKEWYDRQEGLPGFLNRSVVRDAVLAGNDLLPFVEFYHDPANRGWHDYQLPTIQDSILYMREQYAADPDFRRHVDEAVRHVVAAKLKLYPSLTLDEVLVDPAQAAEVAGGGYEQVRTLAADALTLLQPPSVAELRDRLPRGPLTPEKVLIVECWSDCYPYRVMTQSRLQEDLLALYGPDGAGRLQTSDVHTISFGDLDAWMLHPDDPVNAPTGGLLRDAAWIVFALTEYNPQSYPASGAVKRFLDTLPIDVRNKHLIGIAYNSPYHLDSTQISKLAAYFALYNKTEPAIDIGFEAMFGDARPRGAPPVSVSGIFYRVEDAVQPDPEQALRVSVFGQDADAVADTGEVGLVAGPVVDRNGHPVPDGTDVSFALTKSEGGTVSGTATTNDGLAGVALALDGRGRYTAQASVGSIVSSPLAISVVFGSAPEPTASTNSPTGEADTDGGRGSLPLLALAVGIPAALGVAGGGAAGVLWYRRRRSTLAEPQSAPEEPAPPRALVVDAETHRVYVRGKEAEPPFSNEQFRLLLYLYERADKVVGREELVEHVWPDAHSEGVSEEALDALVRRVRERIAQAGGERSFIVTLRGQGFRLEV